MMHCHRTCPSTLTPSRGSRPLRRAALTLIAALALTGCVWARGSQDAGTATGPPHRAIFGPVRAAQLVTATRGWALTPEGLSWTDDGGQAWRDITPPKVAPAGVRGVFFLDGTHGWVVASAGSAAASAVGLTAFRTADAGLTWTSAGVAAPSAANTAAYGGPAWVRFVDGLHGWVLVKDVSSSNFSFGRLYRTSDGGRSWSALEAPLGDPVTFIDQQTGWTAGGPAGDRLFVTRDAGRSWKRQQVQPPSGVAGGAVAYALPVEAGDAVVLPVTVATAGGATIAWYLSRDAGRTWRLANRLATSDRLSPDVRVPVAVAGAGTWVSMLPSSRRLVRLRDDGATIAVQAPATAPAGVQDLQFATATVGWALAASGTCPPGGPCAPGRALFRTGDGGSSWHEVAVR
jgi:photosystem II stability/assembly factor-like uncharacterized protein